MYSKTVAYFNESWMSISFIQFLKADTDIVTEDAVVAPFTEISALESAETNNSKYTRGSSERFLIWTRHSVHFNLLCVLICFLER